MILPDDPVLKKIDEGTYVRPKSEKRDSDSEFRVHPRAEEISQRPRSNASNITQFYRDLCRLEEAWQRVEVDHQNAKRRWARLQEDIEKAAKFQPDCEFCNSKGFRHSEKLHRLWATARLEEERA